MCSSRQFAVTGIAAAIARTMEITKHKRAASLGVIDGLHSTTTRDPLDKVAMEKCSHLSLQDGLLHPFSSRVKLDVLHHGIRAVCVSLILPTS
jgi:hypothetical protein